MIIQRYDNYILIFNLRVSLNRLAYWYSLRTSDFSDFLPSLCSYPQIVFNSSLYYELHEKYVTSKYLIIHIYYYSQLFWQSCRCRLFNHAMSNSC